MALNHGWRYDAHVDPAGAGEPLDRHLARRWPHSDLETWRARLAAGEVEVDGAPVLAARPLEAGQLISWHRAPWEEPEVPRDWSVLHQDPALLAIHKPSGLPTLPGGGFLEHTLLHLVQAAYPEAVPLHRLGRGTSGLVLFARTEAARQRLSAAFRMRGALEKTYRARVSGRLPPGDFVVDQPIGRVPHPLLGTVHGAHPDGRPSRSRVTVLEGGPPSLVEVDLETGRPHQIRIHLAFAGHPLAGDPLYGPGGQPLPGEVALPGDPGYHLHHGRLGLRHPDTGRWLVLRDPWPPALVPRREAAVDRSPR